MVHSFQLPKNLLPERGWRRRRVVVAAVVRRGDRTVAIERAKSPRDYEERVGLVNYLIGTDRRERMGI